MTGRYIAFDVETPNSANDRIRPCFKNCRVLYHFNKMAIAPM